VHAWVVVGIKNEGRVVVAAINSGYTIMPNLTRPTYRLNYQT